jgi:hypothetical protein
MTDHPLDSPRDDADDATRHRLALAVVLALQYLSLGLHFLGFDGYPVVALVIAGIMVVISASVFMDLRWSLPVTRVVAALAVLYLGLLCLGVAGDVAFR